MVLDGQRPACSLVMLHVKNSWGLSCSIVKIVMMIFNGLMGLRMVIY